MVPKGAPIARSEGKASAKALGTALFDANAVAALLEQGGNPRSPIKCPVPTAINGFSRALSRFSTCSAQSALRSCSKACASSGSARMPRRVSAISRSVSPASWHPPGAISPSYCCDSSSTATCSPFSGKRIEDRQLLARALELDHLALVECRQQRAVGAVFGLARLCDLRQRERAASFPSGRNRFADLRLDQQLSNSPRISGAMRSMIGPRADRRPVARTAWQILAILEVGHFDHQHVRVAQHRVELHERHLLPSGSAWIVPNIHPSTVPSLSAISPVRGRGCLPCQHPAACRKASQREAGGQQEGKARDHIACLHGTGGLASSELRVPGSGMAIGRGPR